MFKEIIFRRKLKYAVINWPAGGRVSLVILQVVLKIVRLR